MAKVAKLELKKGNGRYFTVTLPRTVWSAGGKLLFAAKKIIDNDLTDAQASINTVYTDANVVLSATTATYTCGILTSDLVNIQFTEGNSKNKYKGDFKFVPLAGQPISWPGDDEYIEVIVYAPVKQGTS